MDNKEKAKAALDILKVTISGERFGMLTCEAQLILEVLEHQQRMLEIAKVIIDRHEKEAWERHDQSAQNLPT